jgi:Zinc finger, C3HC4 type (RING finger)
MDQRASHLRNYTVMPRTQGSNGQTPRADVQNAQSRSMGHSEQAAIRSTINDHQNIQNIQEVRETPEQLWSLEVLEKQIENLKDLDALSLKLILQARIIVVIQPLIGLFLASAVSLAIFATKSSYMVVYLWMSIPAAMLILSIIEIVFVSKVTKIDLGKAIFYNIINKGLYMVELILLAISNQTPTLTYILFSVLALHMGFYFLSNWYKNKKQAFHYLVSTINPLILTTIAMVGIRLLNSTSFHAAYCILPPVIFCMCYFIYCLYCAVRLCKDICSMNDEEDQNELEIARVSGISSSIIIASAYNLAYVGGLIGVGFIFEGYLSSTDNEIEFFKFFILFLGLGMASIVISALVCCRWSCLLVLYKLEYTETLCSESPEVASVEQKKFKSKFLLKMSNCYFVSNNAEVKKQLFKRDLIKKFFRDIKKEPQIANSPSRVKRLIIKEAKDNTSSVFLKPMGSMHDICTGYTNHAEIQKNKKSLAKNVPALTKIMKNLVEPSHRKIPIRISQKKQTFVYPIMTPSHNLAQVLEPKALKAQRRIFNRYLNKKKDDLKAKHAFDQELCVICNENPANTIVEPCMHGGCCHICAIAAFSRGNAKCIHCRQPVRKVFKVDIQEHNLVKLVADITPEACPESIDDESESQA